MNNQFNWELEKIKRFDFWFGNSFCGIKKLTIFFDDELKVLSNGNINKNVKPYKEEIIKELSTFNFNSWEKKYNNNNNPKLENSWTIRLIFENEILEYTGLDDYPNTWDHVECFVNKYSKFYLHE